MRLVCRPNDFHGTLVALGPPARRTAGRPRRRCLSRPASASPRSSKRGWHGRDAKGGAWRRKSSHADAPGRKPVQVFGGALAVPAPARSLEWALALMRWIRRRRPRTRSGGGADIGAADVSHDDPRIGPYLMKPRGWAALCGRGCPRSIRWTCGKPHHRRTGSGIRRCTRIFEGRVSTRLAPHVLVNLRRSSPFSRWEMCAVVSSLPWCCRRRHLRNGLSC